MTRRPALALLLFGCLVLFASPESPRVLAQDGSAVQSGQLPEALQVVLDEGLQLERQQRWGEALTQYEEAARKYPRSVQLQQRVSLARIHFDLSRRYGDQSYLAAVRELPEEQALDLFSEVGIKIQSHYVDAPNWTELVRSGTQGLDIALHEESFLQTHHCQATEAQVQQLINQIQAALNQYGVQDRRHAQEMVRWIARLTSQRLRLPPTAVILEYTCGATNALDTYSAFLTGDQLDDVYSQIEGNFVGLGIELKADQGSLLIADVIPNGPAERAGIRAGERIIAVDGTSTSETSTEVAADLLKGEQGSYVLVTLLDPAGSTRQLNVRRERVEVPSLEDVQMLDARSGVAYFRISSFQKTTSRDVDAALWRLHREGMRSLIVDVRGNPGGLLTEAVEVADRFVTEGTIVTTHGRSVRENYDYRAHRVGTWRVPLVVLIDGDSASASEIFAGAIRDHRRGTVVGERSYGKGSVQGIFPLRVVKGGVRLTTAKFYSPSGYAISQGGVEPDLAVHVVAKPVTIGVDQLSRDDPVLSAGIKVARDLLARRDAEPSATTGRSAGPASQAGIPSVKSGRRSW